MGRGTEGTSGPRTTRPSWRSHGGRAAAAAAGQDELDLGHGRGQGRARGTRRGPAADHLGADGASLGRPGARLCDARLRTRRQGDEVCAQLVLARIIEPTSKLDSVRVFEEADGSPPSYATAARRRRTRRSSVAYRYMRGRRGGSGCAAACAPRGPGPGRPSPLRCVGAVLRDRRRGRFRESGSPRNAAWNQTEGVSDGLCSCVTPTLSR